MAVINGTSSSETLNGTAENDSINGRAGNDTLRGGTGLDTATYSGSYFDYRFGWSNDHLTITDINVADGDEGVDDLYDIDQLQFSDCTLNINPGRSIRVNTTTTDTQSAPTLTTLPDGGWLVVWEGNGSNDSYGIFGQRYNAAGKPVDDEFLINTTTLGQQRAPSVSTLPDGGWLVCWESKGQDGNSSIFTQRYEPTGTPAGTETLVKTIAANTYPAATVTTLADGGWLVTWEGDKLYDICNIYMQRYDASGTAIDSEAQVNSTAARTGTPATTALSDGGWLVTWSDNPYTQNIFLQHYDSTGNLVGGETQINKAPITPQQSPATALPDGGWVMLWKGYGRYHSNGIYAQCYDSSGSTTGSEIYIGSYSWDNPIITALTDGSWLVISSGTYQRFDAAGNRIGLETPITGGGTNTAATALADGGWILSWEGEGPGDSHGIYTQRYDAQGNPQLLEIQGTSAADTLHGEGFIALSGGMGNDTYVLGDSSYWRTTTAPFVRELSDGGIDTINSYIYSYTLPDNVENYRILYADGDASFYGNNLDNIVYANSRSNFIDGGAGTDTADFSKVTSGLLLNLNDPYYFVSIENVTGSAYADTIFGTASDNIINGGAGTDTANYSAATSGVTVSLALSTAQFTGGAGTDTLLSIEYLTGSNYNDKLTGNSVNNWLLGGHGNDILDGGAGADYMAGGEGSDTFYVDNTGDGVNENQSSSGTDTVFSYLSQYTLVANIENGRILASGAANLSGNGLDNVLYSGSGNNTLNGGEGADTASYKYADSAVTATLASTLAQVTNGSGSDTFVSIENLSGSNYNDALTGNSANNTLNGDLGNDTLDGGSGADTLIGGDGSDIYYVDNASDIVSETNATTSTGGTDTVYSYLLNYTLGNNIENGRILSSSSANLTGNGLNNVLYASSGNNLLNGGDGADTASYLYATSAVTVRLSNSGAQSTGGSGSDTLSSIENLAGSNYNDTLTGNAAANILSGGQGNDMLDGAAGADILIGGDGSDTYYVDNAGDMVSETNAVASSGGTDVVCSSLSAYTLGANIENGLIAATGAADLTGNSLNNQLIAGSGNNILNGGDGIDTASYAFASSAVTVNLALGTAQATGGSGSDTLLAIENLNGSNYNDTLTGNAGNNTINGGGGNDRLIGGAGKDILIGGAGSDTFVFNALSEMGTTSASWDVINDFIRGTDKIDLSKLDANSATAANDAFTQLIASNTAFTAAGQLRLADGVLYGNTDGDVDAEFAIQLIGVSSVSLADFIA